MINVKDIENFLKESVNDLLNGGEGTWFKYLGNDLYLVTGWANDDEICSKIAVNQSSLQSDYELDFNEPYFSDGDFFSTEHCWGDGDHNFAKWADIFLDDYTRLSKMEISENGEIIADNNFELSENLYNDDKDSEDVYEVYRVYIIDNTGYEDFIDYEDEEKARDRFNKEVMSGNNDEVNLIHFVEDDPDATDTLDHWDIEEAKDFKESIKSIKGMRRRKSMKVSENLDNIISTQNKQISEPEHAAEAQTPVYADAMRNLKKTGNLRDEKINDDIENATNHDFEIGKEKKLTLDESLFNDIKLKEDLNEMHVFKRIPDDNMFDVDYYFEDDGLYGKDGGAGIVIIGNRNFTNLIYSKDEDAIKEAFDDSENKKEFIEKLKEITGKNYKYYGMAGYSQGDWQDMYYPEGEFSDDSLKEINAAYMGMYSQYADEDGTIYTVYDTGEDTLDQLAEQTGYPRDSIKLREIKGSRIVYDYED